MFYVILLDVVLRITKKVFNRLKYVIAFLLVVLMCITFVVAMITLFTEIKNIF